MPGTFFTQPTIPDRVNVLRERGKIVDPGISWHEGFGTFRCWLAPIVPSAGHSVAFAHLLSRSLARRAGVGERTGATITVRLHWGHTRCLLLGEGLSSDFPQWGQRLPAFSFGPRGTFAMVCEKPYHNPLAKSLISHGCPKQNAVFKPQGF